VVEELGWGITYGFAGKYDLEGIPLSESVIRLEAKEKGLKVRGYFYIKIKYSE